MSCVSNLRYRLGNEVRMRVCANLPPAGRDVRLDNGAFKAALIHYAKGLSNQLIAKGIRVNAVSPGNTYFEGGIWQNIERGMPDLYKTAMGLNPTGRMGTPQKSPQAKRTLAKAARPESAKSDVGLGRQKRTFGVCDRPFQPAGRDGAVDASLRPRLGDAIGSTSTMPTGSEPLFYSVHS
jgi:hypothetical protein